MFPEKKINILLIEDEEFDVRRVRNTIKQFESTILIRSVIANGRQALDTLQAEKDVYDIVIMDFQIAGGLMGEQLIREIKKLDPAIQIIVITKMTVNLADYNFANSLMRAGAFWYCTKYPGDIEEFIYQPTDFILSIINAFQKRELEKEKNRTNSKLLRTVEETLSQRSIIGKSDVISTLKNQINKCAESDASVLISGSSGTGKELVAINIHNRSKRRLENFVPINCGSIPNDLIESELFGYEKGAFTRATSSKPGLFEHANNGTIFLDEIGELPLNAQVKLLRVIQEGELEKIGRRDPVKVNVRLIAATNKNLEKEVAEKKFREDLYYRLNVIPVYVPQLSERREDIPFLAQHFVEQFSIDMQRPVPALTPEAVAVLQFSKLKGNVRELKNIMQRLLFLDETLITKEMMQKALGLQSPYPQSKGAGMLNLAELTEPIFLKDLERSIRQQYIAYIRANSVSDKEAANKLGLAPPNYHRICKELGIK